MSKVDLLSMSYVTTAAALTALFLAGTTKGLIGIGMPIVAVPLLCFVVPLPVAVALLSVPLVLTNIPQAISGDPLKVVVRRLLPIFFGLIGGIVIGVLLLTSVNPAALKPKPFVGVILIAVAGLIFFAPSLTISPALETIASPLAGLVGGVAGGLAALPGPFVFVYLIALGIQRDRFVQYSSMFLTVAAFLMTVALGGGGVMTWADVLISAAASIPIFLGMWLGTRLRQFVPPEKFRKVILGVVILSGVNLLVK
jgi:uncharacterized membrane protein YfcA